MAQHDFPMVFDVVVHASPAAPVARERIMFDGRGIETLAVSAAELPPFRLSFEQAVDQLATLKRLFIEPDGSFVWMCDEEGTRGQLDGNLYDRDDHLLYSTLKGSCTPSMLDAWLSALGWPSQSIIFQDLRRGWFVDNTVFRTIACSA